MTSQLSATNAARLAQARNRLWGSTLLFIAVLCGAIAFELLEERENASEAAESSLHFFSRAAEERAARLIAGVDEILRFARHEYSGHPNAAAIGDHLADLYRQDKLVRRLDVVGGAAPNRLVSGNGEVAVAEVPAGAMAPGDSLLVGEVHRDADGAWVIGLARPIVKEGGGATEAIVATIDLAPFSAFMRELNSDPLAILALTRRDGRPIALFTSRGEVIGGRDIAARLAAQNAPPGDQPGMLASYDGADRLVSGRQLLDYPLNIVAGWGRTAALDSYTEMLAEKVLVGLLITVVIAFMGWRQHLQLGRQAKADLYQAQAEQRFRDGIAAMREGLLLVDRSGRVVTWNPAYEALMPGLQGTLRTGVPFIDVMRRTLEKIAPGVDAAKAIDERLDHCRTGAECVDLVDDGKRVLVSSGRRTNDGGLIVTVRDATAEYAAKRHLEEREQALRDFAEVAADWFWETDAEHRYTMVSDAAAKFGADTKTMIGKNRADHLGEIIADKAALDAHRADMLAHRPFRALRGIRRTTDGRTVHFVGAGKPLFDAQGRFAGYRGTVTNISRLVEAEDALRRAKNESEQASRAKSQFLANMSHEIRTPLAGVISVIDMLLDDGLSPGQRQKAELARRSADQLMDVIGDILDISKLEAGAVRLELVPTRLPAVVDDAVQVVAARAFAKGLKLETVVDPASRGWFDADPTRLRQVLVNLISNAVKFTEAGGVTVTARAIDDRIEFAVTDTGIGIAVDKLPHLFGKFTQADQSISRRFGGTGLGLAISQEFVALMGGKIEVESEPGRGSTFRFALSLKPAQPKDAPAAARPQPATSPLAGRRVLLVEDDPTNRFAGAEMLRRCGAEVEVAENGEDGLHKAAAARFDLILMDMQMPRMDGLSATRHLRAHAGPNRATPIVALTANAFTDDVAQCLAAGMNAHLAKPLRRATIEAEVPKFLAHARGDAAA